MPMIGYMSHTHTYFSWGFWQLWFPQLHLHHQCLIHCNFIFFCNFVAHQHLTLAQIDFNGLFRTPFHTVDSLFSYFFCLSLFFSLHILFPKYFCILNITVFFLIFNLIFGAAFITRWLNCFINVIVYVFLSFF